MASSFEAGMRLGVDAYDSAERAGLARRRMKIEEDAASQAREEGTLRIAGLRRSDATAQDADAETRRLMDLQTRGVYTGGGAPAGDGVGPAAPSFRPIDTANLGDQSMIEQGLGRLSMLKGDVAGTRQSMANVRELRDGQVYGEAVKRFQKDPTASHDYMRWLNTTSPYLTVAPQMDAKGKPTGYNVMSVGQGGEAVHKFYSPSQMAQLAGATALMDSNPVKALTLIGAVDKDLAATISAYNGVQEKVVGDNNTATHNANQDQTSRITAGAAAQTANAHSAYYGAQKAMVDTELASNKEAREIAAQYEDLDDKDKAGPKGAALQRKFSMLNAKPGSTLRPDTGSGKQPQTLNDAEKIAYGKALEDISAITPNKETGIKDPAKVAQVYRNYGLDPARFGYESELDKRLKALGPGGGAAPAVPGRPLYATPTPQLQAMARRARGTSTAESTAAQAELDARQGESRMSAY